MHHSHSLFQGWRLRGSCHPDQHIVDDFLHSSMVLQRCLAFGYNKRETLAVDSKFRAYLYTDAKVSAGRRLILYTSLTPDV